MQPGNAHVAAAGLAPAQRSGITARDERSVERPPRDPVAGPRKRGVLLMGISLARCLLFLEAGGMLAVGIASCARSSWGNTLLPLLREFPGGGLFTGTNHAC